MKIPRDQHFLKYLNQHICFYLPRHCHHTHIALFPFLMFNVTGVFLFFWSHAIMFPGCSSTRWPIQHVKRLDITRTCGGTFVGCLHVTWLVSWLVWRSGISLGFSLLPWDEPIALLPRSKHGQGHSFTHPFFPLFFLSLSLCLELNSACHAIEKTVSNRQAVLCIFILYAVY